MRSSFFFLISSISSRLVILKVFLMASSEMSLDFLVFTSWVIDLKKSNRDTINFYLSFVISSCFSFFPLMLWYYPYCRNCICPGILELSIADMADDVFFKNIELLISSLPLMTSGIFTSKRTYSASSNYFWFINFSIDYFAFIDCIF